MKIWLTAFFLSIIGLAEAESDLKILVVVGDPGVDTYEVQFAETVMKWTDAAEAGEAEIEVIGIRPGETDIAEQFRTALFSEDAPELWIVMIGHGTFDGRAAKFNVSGPDFTDDDLAAWVAPYEGELAVINTASASGSYIQTLAAPGRIVITATKNEAEIDATRFGDYFAEAIGGAAAADLDNDDQVSLLESFLYASDRVATFFEKEQRVATEHALIDDTGDGAGSRPEWFTGATPNRAPSEEAERDGARAGQKVLVKNAFERSLTVTQRQRRDTLEREVKALRRERETMDETLYYSQLEELLLQLAAIYKEVKDS